MISFACGACGTAAPDALPSADDPAPREPAEGSRHPAEDPRPAAPAPAAASLGSGPFFRAASDLGTLALFGRDAATLGADGALRMTSGAGHEGTDPQPSGYHGGSFYNGGAYRYSVVTSPDLVAASAFDSVIPSFEASTPAGTWISIRVAARVAGAWTKDYELGVWAEDTSTVRRHSVGGQRDADGDVKTDTLELTRAADALRVRVVLFSADPSVTPVLRAVSAVATKIGAAAAAANSVQSALGKDLDVPGRSQMIYPGGGEVWCSPTSTSMLLAYWSRALAAPALLETPPEAAGKCHDVVYDGTGNWPFNTAHASAMGGGRLHAFVTRLSSFAQIERLIDANLPVAISARYKPGELTGSPISSTAGHLLVVRGFTAGGDVICNDPAFPSDATVKVTYRRDELHAAWQGSHGATYVAWPAGTTLPKDPLGAY